MKRPSRALVIAAIVAVTACLQLVVRVEAQDSGPAQRVGEPIQGSFVAATGQQLRPAGDSLTLDGRPVDLVLTSDGRFAYVKTNAGVVVLDAATWGLIEAVDFPQGGGSMHGIALSPDGKRLFATTAQHQLHEASRGDDGRLTWVRSIDLPGPGGKGDSHACGLVLTADGKTAFVALSRNNSVGVVDLEAGKLVEEIAVGNAPFDVELDPARNVLYVSNWGGRKPREGERAEPSSDTPVLVDERGVANSGTVGRIDLATHRMTNEAATGLHPSDIVLDARVGRLYVANANDDTISCVDVERFEVVETIGVHPDPGLPFGSAPNGLALAPDGRRLYVANGGNNAVAVVELAGEVGARSRILGFVPTAWYPGAMAIDAAGGRLFIANVKGYGSRKRPNGRKGDGWNSLSYLGVVSRVNLPDASGLAGLTEQVHNAARLPQVLAALERKQDGQAAVCVPERAGEPSRFEHVVYVIKENRTYDQVFGDLPQGDGDPELCIYGREITPNQHALAEQFVLLDNFYCNGVLSADGHSWATEGNVTDHLEKSFGGFTRSYTFGNDPLTYSSTGFLWDNVLARGLSLRNYGEMDYAEPEQAGTTYLAMLADQESGANALRFKQSIGIERLRRYSCPDYPGWNLRIPDVVRAERFLKEFREAERTGDWPNLVMLYLPQDHTSGTSPGSPRPASCVADNDLALGRIIEAISRSRFWPTTAIFVIEDDPQDGFDHVDGHRSTCLVVSPHSRKRGVVSHFYNQTSVVHTIEQILGCPPMNQMDAMSPLMTACFSEGEADLTPFQALAANVPLGELNPKLSELDEPGRGWAERSLALNFAEVDRADEDTLNRILWHAARGTDAPYPAAFAGAHGKGLAARKLLIQKDIEDDDDDEGPVERRTDKRVPDEANENRLEEEDRPDQ